MEEWDETTNKEKPWKIRKGKWLKIATKVIGSKIFEFLPLLEEMIQFDVLLFKWVV